MRVLRLLRLSQLFALAVVLAVVAALTFLYRGLLLDALVETETRAHVALTQTFVNAMWPRGLDGALAVDEARLKRLAGGLDIVKIKVYDADGRTVFSTDPRQIGEDKSANPGFRRARAGTPASEITYRDHFDAWEGTLAERNIISTYVPVRAAGEAEVRAVFELYSDVTALVAHMQRGLWQILAGVLGAMALVYAALQAILWRYRRLLQEQEAARAAQEERIRHQAYHDALTGLPNRASLAEHLDAAMARARRAHSLVALLFIDLDQFKRVNDSLGHDAGDRLLCVVAKRIRDCVREVDLLFRMGGDEFIVLLEDARTPEEIALVAQRTIDAISEPLQVGHHELAVSASIGIALYPRDEAQGERLLKSADTAMYRAKELGRGRYAFFSPEMHERVESQMLMEAALRQALRNGEFVLHYQPRIDAASARVTGAEALLRWQHPAWGLVEPARFVPLLEEMGLIVPVGAWVLEQACREARAWQDAGAGALRVSVNISARQFRAETLVDTVRAALAASALPPALLELELTESLLVDDAERAIETMTRLKALGVALSIDDFGTGYSSLSYLKRFPIDHLKIDRSFVRDLAASGKDAAIFDAITALARSLGIGVIAEGVEESWQAELLRGRECTELQGHLFGRPMPAAALAALLARAPAPSERAA
ncbi:MAG TPA: EAL domain-containing protein [Burkholderiales bacterium]